MIHGLTVENISPQGGENGFLMGEKNLTLLKYKAQKYIYTHTHTHTPQNFGIFLILKFPEAGVIRQKCLKRFLREMIIKKS